jgi:hypothetical protein
MGRRRVEALFDCEDGDGRVGAWWFKCETDDE